MAHGELDREQLKALLANARIKLNGTKVTSLSIEMEKRDGAGWVIGCDVGLGIPEEDNSLKLVQIVDGDETGANGYQALRAVAQFFDDALTHVRYYDQYGEKIS